MGGLPGRGISERTLAAAYRVRWGSVVVVTGVVGSVKGTSAVPAVDAPTEHVVDAPTIGLGPTLRLDRSVRDGDRSGAADRLEKFRSWAEGEIA